MDALVRPSKKTDEGVHPTKANYTLALIGPANAMSMITCPTCGSLFEPQLSAAMPFCSERCRQIDLGRWFNEEFGLPHESSEDESEDEQEAARDKKE